MLKLAFVPLSLMFICITNSPGGTDTANQVNTLPRITIKNYVLEESIDPGFTFNRHYFSVEKGPQKVHVDYFAGNLAPYLKPVPSAYFKIRMYQLYRLLTPAILIGGAVTGITLAAASPRGEPERLLSGLFIGFGISCTALLPRVLETNQIEDAVYIYNATRIRNRGF